MVPSGLLPAEFRSDSKACLLNEPYLVSCLSRILCSEECNCPTFTCDYSPDYRCSNIGFGNPTASRPCIRFLRKRAKPSGSCARQDHRLYSCRRTPSIRFWDRIVAWQRQGVIVIACSRECRPPRAGESATSSKPSFCPRQHAGPAALRGFERGLEAAEFVLLREGDEPDAGSSGRRM